MPDPTNFTDTLPSNKYDTGPVFTESDSFKEAQSNVSSQKKQLY